MLLESLLGLALLAAPPKAPAAAERLVHVPRLDALSGALPFFRAAGSRSALLAPEGWRSEALPLLGVDVTSAASLALAGLDGAGPLTVSRLKAASFSCVRVADARRFQARVEEALQRLGTRQRVVRSGVAITAARDSLGRVVAAVGTLGTSACTVSSGGTSVEPLFPALVEALTAPQAGPPPRRWAPGPGVAQLLSPGGPAPFAASLAASGLTATVSLRTEGQVLPALEPGGGPTRYGALAPPGLAVLRLRFAPGAMPEVLARLAAAAPGGEALAELAPRLAPLLTGQAAALVWQVRVSTGLRTPEARFHAVKLALVAQTRDPAAATALLGAMDPARLSVREGRLTLEVVGDSVVLANDEGARGRLVEALASATGAQAHALELRVDPPSVAAALAQVPLLEVVRTPELAGLLAASAELGPLLLASRTASLWLDPAGQGGLAGQARWELDPGRFPADGGVP